MGLTIAFMPPAGGAVIAGDVTLYNLSQTLADYQQTPRSELILLEEKDGAYWVMAYKDPQKLIRLENGSLKRTRAIELDSPVINYAATLDDIRKPFSSFSYQQRNMAWFNAAT